MRERQPIRAISEGRPNGALADAELAALSPRHREALEKLESGYALACSHEGFQQYLQVVSHLYAYSPRNVMLIFAQMSSATMVNSYDRWQEAGRQVGKGERGLKVFFPMFRVVEVENEATGETEQHRILQSFGIGKVFDVSQTDGPPIAPPQPPQERFGTTEVARELDRRLSTFLIGKGLRVETKPIPKVRGYLDPEKREVALNAELADDDGKAKTLAHETAHYLAGDTAGWEGRSLREFIAEGSAYAALLAMGVDTSDYSLDYIKWWTRELGMIKRAMPEIAVVTRKLIAIMEGERPEEMEAWL